MFLMGDSFVFLGINRNGYRVIDCIIVVFYFMRKINDFDGYYIVVGSGNLYFFFIVCSFL